MIAADTSTWIAFFQGEKGQDVALLDRALAERQAALPPVVLTELLSDPSHVIGLSGLGGSAPLLRLLQEVPLLETTPGFWERAGQLRAKVLKSRQKARLGDALIAQSCLDHRMLLITRDRDFLAFERAAGLRLVVS